MIILFHKIAIICFVIRGDSNRMALVILPCSMLQ